MEHTALNIGNIDENEKNISYTSNNYGEILESYGLEYQSQNYYLQVGEITKTQGWILHLTAIISQVESLFKLVIPILIEERVPFKIPASIHMCINLLTGNYGPAQIGKVISVYPDNDSLALSLAKRLVAVTSSFKGPLIPTDIALGNIVYTRYGSFNPVIISDSNGRPQKYIYNAKGELVLDLYEIPFQFPEGVSWPFETVASPNLPKPKNVFKGVYKPLFVLKSDPRGNVLKGLYLKSLLNVKNCVIKQGFKNMASEENGRDIRDRLIWQQQLYFKLWDSIPLPKIYDLFDENGDTFLVMEYINGQSFYDKIKELNPNSKHWILLPFESKIQLLNYLLTIISIIETLHKKGYVHRDVMPANFMIDKKNRLFLIDIELAYSLHDNYPNPPFQLGTAGFMSPEQKLALTPTIKEDIYGLGAMLLLVFTGLTPVRFDTKDSARLHKNVSFFIKENEILTLIISCLNQDPFKRPELSDVKQTLLAYKNKLEKDKPSISKLPLKSSFNTGHLKSTIELAIEGLNKPPMILADDLWYSKAQSNENSGAISHKEYTRYVGICEGIGGVLYVLARANKIGLNIDSCKLGFVKGWHYVMDQYLTKEKELPAGLYDGFAGLAIALTEAMDTELMEKDATNKSYVRNFLTMQTHDLNLASGIAGQGIALLRCNHYLEEQFVHKKLVRIVDTLLKSQQNDGAWLLPADKGEKNITELISHGYGIVGIILFLLEYHSLFPNAEVEVSIKKSLDWILKRTRHLKNFFDQSYFQKNVLQDNAKGDERKGIILTFIKAYEVLGLEYFKEMAEKALYMYPSHMVNTNFSQLNGLAAMGELYLEAWRVLKTNEWQERAFWIAGVYIHSCNQNDYDSIYWMMEENANPTADFMVGNGGIIHFLSRCLDPEKIGYRLL